RVLQAADRLHLHLLPAAANQRLPIRRHAAVEWRCRDAERRGNRRTGSIEVPARAAGRIWCVCELHLHRFHSQFSPATPATPPSPASPSTSGTSPARTKKAASPEECP